MLPPLFLSLSRNLLRQRCHLIIPSLIKQRSAFSKYSHAEGNEWIDKDRRRERQSAASRATKYSRDRLLIRRDESTACTVPHSSPAYLSVTVKYRAVFTKEKNRTIITSLDLRRSSASAATLRLRILPGRRDRGKSPRYIHSYRSWKLNSPDCSMRS